MSQNGNLVLPTQGIITINDVALKTGIFLKFDSREDETLFPQAPSLADLKQMYIGDCYLIASLAALVAVNPDLIKAMMKDELDGNVVVRLFETNGVPIYIRVQKSKYTLFFKWERDHAARALWVHLIEKAYGYYRVRYEGHSADDSLMKILEGGHSSNALRTLLGNNTIKDHTLRANIEIIERVMVLYNTGVNAFYMMPSHHPVVKLCRSEPEQIDDFRRMAALVNWDKWYDGLNWGKLGYVRREDVEDLLAPLLKNLQSDSTR